MVIITKRTRKTLSRIIRKEFDSLDSALDWFPYDSNYLIDTAKELGFDELAREMEIDKNLF